MKASVMLGMMARRYASEEGGPRGRRADAETLLAMAPSLEEQSARVYLERFMSKWRVGSEEAEEEGTGWVRRRPMTQLERRAQAKMARSPRREQVRVTAEDAEGRVVTL